MDSPPPLGRTGVAGCPRSLGQLPKYDHYINLAQMFIDNIIYYFIDDSAWQEIIALLKELGATLDYTYELRATTDYTYELRATTDYTYELRATTDYTY